VLCFYCIVIGFYKYLLEFTYGPDIFVTDSLFYFDYRSVSGGCFVRFSRRVVRGHLYLTVSVLPIIIPITFDCQ